MKKLSMSVFNLLITIMENKKFGLGEYLFTLLFLVLSIIFFTIEIILSVLFFFVFIFLCWVLNDNRIDRAYWKGFNCSKKDYSEFFEREFRNKNNYMIIETRKKERERIVNLLESRLMDDAVLDEYYHGYIQAMLDDLK